MIAAQLVWAVITGVAARAERWAGESWAVYLLLAAVVIGYLPMQYGAPILAWRFASRAGLSVWKLWLVAGVEVAIAFVLLIAMMPLFQ